MIALHCKIRTSVSGMINASLPSGGLMPSASYPKVSAKAWSSLRAKANNSPSTRFTPENVSVMLEMASPKSANDNVVSPLRKLGLLNDDGTLTERGNKWRIDSSYGDACQEILDEVYPGDLAGFANHDGDPELSQVMRWMQQRGNGASNARNMASTYVMIAQKKIPEVDSQTTKQAPQNGSAKRPPSKARVKNEAAKPTVAEMGTPSIPDVPRSPEQDGPNIHLDIQIHIPVDATADQIDQIFASMGKHLYRK